MAQLKDTLISGSLRVTDTIFTNDLYASGEIYGNATSANKWQTPRILTVGNTGKSVDGSENISWSLNEIMGSSDNSKFYRGDKTWSNTLSVNNTTYANGILVLNNTGDAGWLPSLACLSPNITSGHYIGLNIGRATGSNNSCAHLSYYYNSDATKIRVNLGFYNNTDLLTITTGGNVGIGKTSQDEKLDVNGNIKGNKFHSNASAETNLTAIPEDSAIALETGNGDGATSAWIWREKYAASNWGIFHDNSKNILHMVGSNISRLAIELTTGKITINEGDLYLGKGFITNRSTVILNSTAANPADIIFHHGSTTTSNYGHWAISSRGGIGDNYNLCIYRGVENGGISSEKEVFHIDPKGCLSITPDNKATSWNEGIRLHAVSSKCATITLCGTDNTGDTGTSTNTWSIHNCNGNFYITQNGSTDTNKNSLRCVGGVWSWNGIATGSISGNAATATALGTNAGSSTIPVYFTEGKPAAITTGTATYTKSITVTGDANTYYPVVITATTDKTRPHIISIWKNLGSTTASYSGNHSNGTSSLWAMYEHRNTYWDGNGGYCRCLYFYCGYATLVAKAQALGSGVGKLCIWLRGGTTEYKVSSDYDFTVTAYYSSTNLGSTQSPVTVEPTTTVTTNGWRINGTFYGNITGSSDSCTGNAATATKATQDSDGHAINSTYFKLTETRAATTSNTFSITNATASTSKTTGALKVKGGVGVEGSIYANQVYNAVWNDYAEYRKCDELAPGMCVQENDDGKLTASNHRLIPACSIITDTFGFSEGETDDAKTPVAVAGRVLAYTYLPRHMYHAGMAVCSAPGGTIDIMTREEIREYPDCIIGYVSEIPDYEEWGSGNVKVNGRIWIKVK